MHRHPLRPARQRAWRHIIGSAILATTVAAGSHAALPAWAGVDPASYSGTLAPGGSVTIEKTVDVPEVPPKLDLVLDVDLSGSYGDDIETIKGLKSAIFTGVTTAVPDAQFGLTTFVDYPFSPWGSLGSGDYAYQLDQDLTATQATWEAAVDAMATKYGGDEPESQLESLYQAATGAGRDINGDTILDPGDVPSGLGVSFRPDATKVIALTTDASMHVAGDPGDSFPYPGPSYAETVAALTAAGIKVVAIKAPGSGTQMDDLATDTGGAVVTTGSSSDEIVTAILAGLEALTFDVTAVPVGCDPLVVTYDPASHDDVPGGTPVVFDETIEVPDGTPSGPIDCTVEFYADDTLIGTQTIHVDVDTPPDCSAAAPSVTTLWPPSHTLVDVTIGGVVDDGTTTVTIDSIFQDEPTNGLGDGDVAPDGFGVGTDTAQLRSERSGTADGRVYHVAFTATDDAGQECSGTVSVSVPKSLGKGGAAVDGGALYDSTV